MSQQKLLYLLQLTSLTLPVGAYELFSLMQATQVILELKDEDLSAWG